MSDVLDPLTLPLQGSQLIEASAGTGKTWTIAALYVRLVLGHGGPLVAGVSGPGGRRPMLPGEILVMTFTKAATRELSDRIRRRLVEAAARFRGEAVAGEDGFLTSLLEAYPEGPQRQEAAWRLGAAAQAMDDAAVHTIDAWCQRMLREHAFDSGCLFDEELQANEAAIQAEAARDYWRQQVYPLSGDALAAVLERWSGPEALLADIKGLLNAPLPTVAGQGSVADCLERSDHERANAVAALKEGWPSRADAMLGWLSPIWSDKKHPARSLLPGQANATRWIQALKEWALDPAAESPDVKKGAERLTHSAIQAAFVHDPTVAIPACFAEFEGLMAALKALPVRGPALWLHAAAGVGDRMQQIKTQAGAFGFADMLRRLDEALDESVHGAKARQLRQRIGEQYPAALIDEFQDTSPVQLRIFDRLYRIADNDPSRALLLIGDPKQAIYAFRGADIYSYLRAREATLGRHHVLGTNHRSTRALVEAVNHVFKAAEDRPGEGAFMFRKSGKSALPFVEVQAKGRREKLVDAAGELRAVTIVVDGDLRNAASSRELFAALCAERIVTLLNDTQAGFAEDGKPFRRLMPSDIAVLVRTGTEAAEVKRSLGRRGLASVYLSDKETVFRTAEAADLLRLLQSVAAPRDVGLARAALATPLMGASLEELVALSSDDERFDRQCEVLQQLNAVWKTQGVLAMLRRALHAFGLPARLLAGQGEASQGERRLTNVLHLAELLQGAGAQVEGEQALIRWLAQQLDADDDGLVGGDELVLRLESDADLVKVVTVHKSKGLEYPLVFLPFPADFRDADSGESATFLLPDDKGRQSIVLGPTKEQLEARRKEDQREALRLLYVAATRARHALWVGLSGLRVGKSKEYIWHRSGVGYLLSGAQEKPPEQRVPDVQALAQACPHIAVEVIPPAEALPLPPVTPLQAREPLPALLPAPAYDAPFDRNWSISSYSALVRDATWGPAGGSVSAVRPLREDEPNEGGDEASPSRQADQPWHRFPRGAVAGNFLHDQLEWLATENFALDASAALQGSLVRRCEQQGWGHRAEDALAWLRKICTSPLPALGVPLAALTTLAPEMEFWFPSDGLQSSRVDELCRQYVLPGGARPDLPERTLEGMLMGFADLVFEHEGRYWVLDYKSNALGARDADYTDQAMGAAMLEHRYDVQAALYLLALHRLLRARLGKDYVPARHIGGAIYLFLRGVDGPAGGCCDVLPPMALLDALDSMIPLGSKPAAREVA